MQCLPMIGDESLKDSPFLLNCLVDDNARQVWWVFVFRPLIRWPTITPTALKCLPAQHHLLMPLEHSELIKYKILKKGYEMPFLQQP